MFQILFQKVCQSFLQSIFNVSCCLRKKENSAIRNLQTSSLLLSTILWTFHDVFFSCTWQRCYHSKYKCNSIDVEDQLFLTMIKHRQNKDDFELSLFFKVSQPVISNLMVTWTNFMYHQLNEINFWPSRSINSQYMPEDFKRKFPSTCVILDATETLIQKPSKLMSLCKLQRFRHTSIKTLWKL